MRPDCSAGASSILLPFRRRHPGLDPEFPKPQPIVGLELDGGAREQHQPLPARVLEQVAGQLLGQGALVVGEALPIARGQEHPVLVGRIGSGDGEGLVLLHLAGEFARDLNGPYLRAKCPAKGAFDEVGDLVLETSEDAHGWAARRLSMLRG